jgi:hypothetical protein
MSINWFFGVLLEDAAGAAVVPVCAVLDEVLWASTTDEAMARNSSVSEASYSSFIIDMSP